MARRLAALDEGDVRARAAARALEPLAPERAAAIIAEWIRCAAGADARQAVAAVGRALLDPEGGFSYERLAQVYAAASKRGLTEVTSLLLEPRPRRAWEEPHDKPDPRLAHLTLGHKKMLARRDRDPDLLARLAAEGEPGVVRELLRNPLLTEPFAVRIAARRPCRPETLRCLYEERRWRSRPAVAVALAKNPYAEPAIAVKLLPTLPPAELAEIAHDRSLHPLVRALAARLGGVRGAPEGTPARDG